MIKIDKIKKECNVMHVLGCILCNYSLVEYQMHSVKHVHISITIIKNMKHDDVVCDDYLQATLFSIEILLLYRRLLS